MISYICVWLFSIYMIGHSYKVNEFIKETYEHEASRIEKDIRKIQPSINTLKNLYLSIQEYKQELQAIEQNAVTPLNLADRLFSISKIVPERIWLEEISLATAPNKTQSANARPHRRKLNIRGAYFLKSSRPDLQYLNEFKDLLEQNGVLSMYVQNLNVISSEITNVRNKPVVSFQLEGNWIYSYQNTGY